MIAAAAWLWGLVGIVVFLALGLLLMLALGLLGAPGDFLRRAGQSATAPRVEDGVPLPDEVPGDDPSAAGEQRRD